MTTDYDCVVPHRYKNIDTLDEIGTWLAWLKQEARRTFVLRPFVRRNT